MNGSLFYQEVKIVVLLSSMSLAFRMTSVKS